MAITKPLGLYMFKVFSGERTWLSPVLRPVEPDSTASPALTRTRSRAGCATPSRCCCSASPAWSLTYLIQRLQGSLPFNPPDMPAVKQDLAFNTAASFTTNTNWQGYGGESTMSYFTQMAALAVQNFLSAAAGIAVALALIRGIARRRADIVGNFWVDMVRAVLYILLPMSIVVALFLVWQGVPQNLNDYTARPASKVSRRR